MPLSAGTLLYRVYDGTWGYDEHNPGYGGGDARSTHYDPAHGGGLPACIAATPTAALLETVFHDVHHDSARIVYERDLLGKLLARVGVPAIGALGDLRDPELKRLGLDRGEVVASPAEHYPCTRRLAVEGLARTFTQGVLQGFIWHSRQANSPARTLRRSSFCSETRDTRAVE